MLICGFISAITAVLLLSRVFAGQTITGQGTEFDCLTAALLGGVSFKGGEGTVFGLITGIIIIGVLNNAMQLASFPDFSQTVVKGAVLLIAVAFDVYQKNRKAKETVARLIEDIGFIPVDTGSLSQGGRAQQPGSPIYGHPMTAEDAREIQVYRA